MKPHIKSEHYLNLSDRKEGIRFSLLMFGAVLFVMLLNGCASLGRSGDSDPWQYNANTGYPAVGSPSYGSH